jgi:molecular chaperone HtpG
MERIMKAQALRDPNMNSYMVSKKTLELNPTHPIIKALQTQVKNQVNTNSLKDVITLLFESALINSGFSLEEPTTFVNRINRIIQLGLSIEDEEELSKAEEEADEAEDEDEDDEEEDKADEEAEEAEESNMEDID